MTSNVLHAPQTIGIGARRLICVALGILALALVVAALSSNGGSTTSSGTAVLAGKAVAVAHVDEPSTAATISGAQDGAVPPGSGISFGRHPGVGYEPNLLPK